MLRPAAVTVSLLALALAAPAAADTPSPDLTPEGPATIRAFWNGPSTLEGRPPEILVGWSVTVGPNSKAGPVRLRVVHGWPTATVRGSGPVVQLPADPGTYSFALPAGIPYDPREHGLSLDQEVGGHAILGVSELAEHEVHLFRPRLAEDARDVGPTQGFTHRQMRITGVIERDLDGDLVGDQTQDTGDLRVLRAHVAGRSADGWTRIEARVRNVGASIRHRPGIRIPDGPYGWQCDRPADTAWRSCAGPALAPGQETTVSIRLQLPAGAPQTVTVESEGPDLNPADNTIAVSPALTLAKAAGASPRVRLGAGRPGKVTLVARIAGIRITRTITFARPDRRVVRLLPARRADRRRLARALRRPGRLNATVTATTADDRATLRASF